MKPIQFNLKDFESVAKQHIKQTYTCANVAEADIENAGVMCVTLVFDEATGYFSEEYSDLFIYDYRTNCRKHLQFRPKSDEFISSTAENIINALEDMRIDSLDDSIVELVSALHRDSHQHNTTTTPAIAARRLTALVRDRWDILYSLRFVSHSRNVRAYNLFENTQCLAVAQGPTDVNSMRFLLFFGQREDYDTNACVAIEMLDTRKVAHNLDERTAIYSYTTGNIMDVYDVNILACSVWSVTHQRHVSSLQTTWPYSNLIGNSVAQSANTHPWYIALSMSITSIFLIASVIPWVSHTRLFKRAVDTCSEFIDSICRTCCKYSRQYNSAVQNTSVTSISDSVQSEHMDNVDEVSSDHDTTEAQEDDCNSVEQMAIATIEKIVVNNVNKAADSTAYNEDTM